MVVVIVVMVMTMVVVLMVSLMVGDDATDGDIIGGGDDYDGDRGSLNWDTSKCLTVRVHAPLFLPNIFLNTLYLPKYICFNTGSAPVWLDTVSYYL